MLTLGRHGQRGNFQTRQPQGSHLETCKPCVRSRENTESGGVMVAMVGHQLGINEWRLGINGHLTADIGGYSRILWSTRKTL